MKHPDDATLQTWFDGALDGDEGDAVAAHVADCDPCSAKVDGLERLHGAMVTWADSAPAADDFTAGVLARLEAPAQKQTPASATVVPLDAARARRSGGRRMLWPAVAVAAAAALVVATRIPERLHAPRLPDVPRVVAEGPVTVGGGLGGAEVTLVDVRGAQGAMVLEVPGATPGTTTAVVWIQDPPSEDSR